MTSSVRRILLAGLLGPMIVSAGPADPWSSAQKLVVVLADNRFEPDHLTFRAGQAYELRLENHGKELHEFTARTFLKAATVRDQTLAADVSVVPSEGETTPKL